MWLLYVALSRLGGGGMFDQFGYYMSLLQDLVEEACLIRVVTICRCCKTWWRSLFDQCGYYMSLLQDLVEGHV